MDINRIKKFFHNQSVVLIGWGYVILLAVLALFVIIPFIKNIRSINDDFQRKFIEQQVAGEKISKLDEMEQVDKQYQSRKSDLERFFQSEQEVDFIKALEKSAEDSKIKIKIDANDQGSINKESAAINKDEVQKNLKYKNYFILKITTEGDYVGFLHFIYQLEHFQYFVNILSISGEMRLPENKDNAIIFNPFANENGKNSSATPQGIFEGILTVAVYTR